MYIERNGGIDMDLGFSILLVVIGLILGFGLCVLSIIIEQIVLLKN